MWPRQGREDAVGKQWEVGSRPDQQIQNAERGLGHLAWYMAPNDHVRSDGGSDPVAVGAKKYRTSGQRTCQGILSLRCANESKD
jgi:hypothetical protein